MNSSAQVIDVDKIAPRMKSSFDETSDESPSDVYSRRNSQKVSFFKNYIEKHQKDHKVYMYRDSDNLRIVTICWQHDKETGILKYGASIYRNTRKTTNEDGEIIEETLKLNVSGRRPPMIERIGNHYTALKRLMEYPVSVSNIKYPEENDINLTPLDDESDEALQSRKRKKAYLMFIERIRKLVHLYGTRTRKHPK